MRIKILNPVGRDYPDFFMAWDTLPSRPVLTLATEDVPRCPDWDAGRRDASEMTLS